MAQEATSRLSELGSDRGPGREEYGVSHQVGLEPAPVGGLNLQR